MEIWKSIDGYIGLYEVSSMGRVKSCSNSFTRKEKILKPNIQNGYPKVKLFRDGNFERKSVHRLVAIAFIPNPLNLPFVNHLNSNKADATHQNLEWCTHRENMLHAVVTRQKKTPDEIFHLRLTKFMERNGLSKSKLLSLLSVIA